MGRDNPYYNIDQNYAVSKGMQKDTKTDAFERDSVSNSHVWYEFQAAHKLVKITVKRKFSLLYTQISQHWKV